MPSRKKKRGVRPIELAKSYLQTYPAASSEQVAQALGVSPRTVTTARAALVQAGVMPRSYFDRKNLDGPLLGTPTPPTGPILPVEGIADLGKALEAFPSAPGASITTPEMRERLTAVARRAAFEGAGSLEIAAIQAIAKMDASTGERDRLGPGVPLTRADKVSRLSRLMKVCGQSISNESLINTFGKETDGQPTQENQAPEAASSPPEHGSGLGEQPDALRSESLPSESGQVG